MNHDEELETQKTGNHTAEQVWHQLRSRGMAVLGDLPADGPRTRLVQCVSRSQDEHACAVQEMHGIQAQPHTLLKPQRPAKSHAVFTCLCTGCEQALVRMT